MKLNKNTAEIYLVSNANFATGGPFLLHQLAHKLIQMGYNAKMLYLKTKLNENPVHPFYRHFEIPFTDTVDDSNKNLIIIPEIYPEMIFDYKKIKKIIWWLSVDNFLESRQAPSKFSLKRFFGLKPKIQQYKFNKKPKHEHWVQSFYAKSFLKKNNIDDISYLSDFLNSIFINELKNETFNKKEDIVAYNPKKGYEVTKKLIEIAPHIKWVPIENMNPQEVQELLIRSKIYIDFGNHPGKDRIPREAAMCGCIVITNNKGAAKFSEDVTIPNRYKIDYSDQNINKILELIETSFINYENDILAFDEYKEIIINEEAKFESDLQAIISDLFTG